MRKVYACLTVTCHLHFGQNDRDLLRATAVTRGWNGYRNKSQHRKLALEKKILPPLLQGFEPATFQSRVRRSTEPMSHPRVVKLAGCVVKQAGYIDKLAGCVVKLSSRVVKLANCVVTLAGCVVKLDGCVVGLVGFIITASIP